MGKSTSAEKRAAKRYYDSHPKEKAKKIAKQVAKQKANKGKFAKIQRDRYHGNKEYKEYKIDYAENYYRKHKKRMG